MPVVKRQRGSPADLDVIKRFLKLDRRSFSVLWINAVFFFLLFFILLLFYKMFQLRFTNQALRRKTKKQFWPGSDLWIIECYDFLVYPRSLPTVTSSSSPAISPPSTFLAVNVQIHGATDHPVALTQLADVGASNEPTAPRCVSLSSGFWRRNILFFFIWPSGNQKNLKTSKSTTPPDFLLLLKNCDWRRWGTKTWNLLVESEATECLFVV